MTDSPDKHILVVEDDRNLRTILDFNLKRLGFQVTVASDGEQAWRLAQQHSFDFVVTDYSMPKKDGVELMRRLREDDKYSQTPMILISALSGELDLPMLCNGLNVLAFFPKPFSPVNLARTVEECLAMED